MLEPKKHPYPSVHRSYTTWTISNRESALIGGWRVVCPSQNHWSLHFMTLTTSAPAFNTHGVPTFGAKPCARQRLIPGCTALCFSMFPGEMVFGERSTFTHQHGKHPAAVEHCWSSGLQTLLHLVLFHLTSAIMGVSKRCHDCPCPVPL